MSSGRRIPLAMTSIGLLALACVLVPRVAFTGPSEVVRIRADKAWNSTNIRIHPGDRLTITYLRGEWSPWPGGSYDATGSGGDPLCRCNVMEAVSHAALIGRIGGAEPFLVGREFDHVVGESGTLLLGINDVDINDNSGALEVLVEIDR